jgi:glutamate N-acetyltransferase/amino-acid N-acetyltransferase
VKSSFYGSDPYWGRVLSELGVADIAMDTELVSIAYDDVVVSRGLAPTGADARPVSAAPEFTLTCKLGVGTHRYHVHTNDLSHAYIDENMRTS